MNSKQITSISIVIPNYNGVSLLKNHLPAVIKAAKNAEIIVVDDASTDESVAFLHRNYPQIKVVALKTNQRFAAACNAGVAAAGGEVIVLLNSDVSPTQNFLSPLITPFTAPEVFAVGCKEIQTHNGITIEAGRAGGEFNRGLFIHWRADSQNNTDTLWVSGGSGAFRKSIWESLGGMDTLFAPAYEEDRDLCYRALKRGFLVLFAPESVVYHNHESTNKTALGNIDMQVSAHKNNLLFIWKNISDHRLFLEHLLWLPYHLLLTTIRTKGMFLMGFFRAVTVLPAVFQKRAIEIRNQTVSDQALIRYAATIN